MRGVHAETFARFYDRLVLGRIRQLPFLKIGYPFRIKSHEHFGKQPRRAHHRIIILRLRRIQHFKDKGKRLPFHITAQHQHIRKALGKFLAFPDKIFQLAEILFPVLSDLLQRRTEHVAHRPAVYHGNTLSDPLFQLFKRKFCIPRAKTFEHPDLQICIRERIQHLPGKILPFDKHAGIRTQHGNAHPQARPFLYIGNALVKAAECFILPCFQLCEHFFVIHLFLFQNM